MRRWLFDCMIRKVNLFQNLWYIKLLHGSYLAERRTVKLGAETFRLHAWVWSRCLCQWLSVRREIVAAAKSSLSSFLILKSKHLVIFSGRVTFFYVLKEVLSASSESWLRLAVVVLDRISWSLIVVTCSIRSVVGSEDGSARGRATRKQYSLIWPCKSIPTLRSELRKASSWM